MKALNLGISFESKILYFLVGELVSNMADIKVKLQDEIKQQGETVRKLKAEKADKEKVRFSE